jgi:uncharacterized membrane protein
MYKFRLQLHTDMVDLVLSLGNLHSEQTTQVTITSSQVGNSWLIMYEMLGCMYV